MKSLIRKIAILPSLSPLFFKTDKYFYDVIKYKYIKLVIILNKSDISKLNINIEAVRARRDASPEYELLLNSMRIFQLLRLTFTVNLPGITTSAARGQRVTWENIITLRLTHNNSFSRSWFICDLNVNFWCLTWFAPEQLTWAMWLVVTSSRRTGPSHSHTGEQGRENTYLSPLLTSHNGTKQNFIFPSEISSERHLIFLKNCHAEISYFSLPIDTFYWDRLITLLLICSTAWDGFEA